MNLLCTKIDPRCRKALGVGQALHSFFWWGDRRDVEVEVAVVPWFRPIQRIRSEASPDQLRSLDKPSLQAPKGATCRPFVRKSDMTGGK